MNLIIKNGRADMGYKKIIHRMVFVRHGETEANKDLTDGININSHNLDTKLSDVGKLQALQVGKLFKSIEFKPNLVIVSKLSRAYDTALPTLNYLNDIDNFKFKLDINENWIEYNNKKNEMIEDIRNTHGENWIYPQETKSEFISRIQKIFEDLKKYGSINEPFQTLIFTHSQVISTILSHCLCSNSNSNSNLNQTELYYHLTNGSITCLDITEDNSIHIHTVNYTKHLLNPTGHHIPFV